MRFDRNKRGVYSLHKFEIFIFRSNPSGNLKKCCLDLNVSGFLSFFCGKDANYMDWTNRYLCEQTFCCQFWFCCNSIEEGAKIEI